MPVAGHTYDAQVTQERHTACHYMIPTLHAADSLITGAATHCADDATNKPSKPAAGSNTLEVVVCGFVFDRTTDTSPCMTVMDTT